MVFLGDSITAGWRLKEYFPDRDVLNRGIGGQVTGEMLGRFKTDVIDLKPAAVLILAGTNDLARGTPIEIIENNLAMMADLAGHHKIKVAIASVLPVSDYHKQKNPAFEMTRRRPPQLINALNAWIRNLCQARGYVYIDYAAQLTDGSGFLREDTADDGLHPNALGYRLMAPVAQETMARLAK